MEKKTIFSEKELEKLTSKFNKNTRVLEWVSGSTYFIEYKDPKGKLKSHRLKSCCLDELLTMYKHALKGMQIPERKHFLVKPN